MKLDKIKIERFKSLSSVALDLDPINYIVGGNNAEKTSVLQAIHTVVTAAQTSAELQWKIISDNLIKYCPTKYFADIGHNVRSIPDTVNLIRKLLQLLHFNFLT